MTNWMSCKQKIWLDIYSMNENCYKIGFFLGTQENSRLFEKKLKSLSCRLYYMINANKFISSKTIKLEMDKVC